MRIPDNVKVVEVGPRDGLQSIEEYVPAASKVALIDALSFAGLSCIEITSFAHPQAVPQMKDAEEVVRAIKKESGVEYRAWVPNVVGARRAIEAGIDSLNMAVAASETFNQRNLRRSIRESMDEFQAVADLCREHSVGLCGSVTTAFGCPFEDRVPMDRVVAIADEFLEAGASHVILCDTIGIGNPLQVSNLLEVLMNKIPAEAIAVHLHNTRGAGLANILAALDCGVSVVESSIGGLGGCPFAPGANGNVATEDLANMLEGMGVRTGLDIEALISCAQIAERLLNRELPGQVMRAGRSCGVRA